MQELKREQMEEQRRAAAAARQELKEEKKPKQTAAGGLMLCTTLQHTLLHNHVKMIGCLSAKHLSSCMVATLAYLAMSAQQVGPTSVVRIASSSLHCSLKRCTLQCCSCRHLQHAALPLLWVVPPRQAALREYLTWTAGPAPSMALRSAASLQRVLSNGDDDGMFWDYGQAAGLRTGVCVCVCALHPILCLSLPYVVPCHEYTLVVL